MTKSNAYIWLHRWLLHTRRYQQAKGKGFTLIEVLVSLVIAAIVILGLLFIVVELLRTDQRELALEQVQGDMQRALEFMADDLREAVYVYPDPAAITGMLGTLDGVVTASGSEPVLAFWRTDAIDTSTLPDDCSTEGANAQTCDALKIRRATYTLVAYYQRPQFAPWEGASTINRYELTHYEDLSNAADRYSVTDGYREPLNISNREPDFAGWEPVGATDGGSRTVLADFIKVPRPGEDPPATAIDCSDANLTGDPSHVLVPAAATNQSGFFACISPPDAVAGNRVNQDVFLFLQGDARTFQDGDPIVAQFLQPSGTNSRLPVLRTQIKLNGVIERAGS